MIVGQDEKPKLDDLIVHFGVKGMKWGVHKKDTSSGSSSRDTRKADKAAANEKRDKAIDRARGRLASGKIGRELDAAEAKFKADKAVVGRREAKKALNKVKAKLRDEVDLADSLKSGKESAEAITTAIGSIALSVLAGAAQARTIN